MSKTLMVVDDSFSMRLLSSFTLKDAGYDVIEASSGSEALEKLSSVKVDMVISDFNMPGMNGIEFIRRCRSLEAFKFTPIVMLTTDYDETLKQECRNVGASGWLVKPFNPVLLLETVKKFIH